MSKGKILTSDVQSMSHKKSVKDNNKIFDRQYDENNMVSSRHTTETPPVKTKGLNLFGETQSLKTKGLNPQGETQSLKTKGLIPVGETQSLKTKGLNPEEENEKSLKNTDEKNKQTSLEKMYVFLNRYRAETKKNNGKNLPCTHTSMGGLLGKFNIPDDATKMFHELYTKAVLDDFQPHITELHREFGPIIIDIDITQPNNLPDRCYRKRHIIQVVTIYNELIKKYIDCENKDIHAYVMEKEKPVKRDGLYHDGFHITYPFICTKPSTQFIMREDLIEKLKEQNIFGKFPFKYDLENMVDKKPIYHTGWLMYGSRKNTFYNAYKLTHIYVNVYKPFPLIGSKETESIIGEPIDIFIPGEETTPYMVTHLIRETSIRKFNENDINLTSITVDENEMENRIKKIASKINIEKHDDHAAHNFLGKDISFVKVTSDEELAEAKKLVKMLSSKMARDYETWYPVGRCLHNIDHRLLEDWIAFSKKYPKKYKEGECEMLWKKMKPSNYTISTLHYYAIRDNPEKYHEYKKTRIGLLVEKGLDEGNHRSIARILLEKYGYKFRCASIKYNLWYEYKNHRWNVTECANTLKNIISTEIVEHYRQLKGVILEETKGTEGRKEKKNMEEIRNISDIIKKLGDANFKKGVISECCDMAYDSNFMKVLDENMYSIGFENGVYDLETKIFRDGCPDDYISFTTGYNYIPYDKNDEYSIEIDNFIEKIEPEFEMREYIMTLFSTCLSGSIKEESFYVLTGSGANGKSKIMELLKWAMGDYYKPMDIRVLTEKRSSASAASPEMADKKGIRVCPLDEPNSTDEINTGFMKIFTGGDTITARALFKEPIYFKPQFKPFLLCNHLPNISANDDGTWRRLKVIPFRSKFVKQADMTREMLEGIWPDRTWPADLDISDKVEEWKQMFMGKLIMYYIKYSDKMNGGLKHPQIVLERTNEYRKRCDVIQDFMADYLMKTNDINDTISVGKLHENLKLWHKANYDGKPPTGKDLRGYLKTRLGCINEKKDVILGFRIKPTSAQQDDLDNSE